MNRLPATFLCFLINSLRFAHWHPLGKHADDQTEWGSQKMFSFLFQTLLRLSSEWASWHQVHLLWAVKHLENCEEIGALDLTGEHLVMETLSRPGPQEPRQRQVSGRGRHNWFLSRHWAPHNQRAGSTCLLFTNLGPAFYIKIISNFGSPRHCKCV